MLETHLQFKQKINDYYRVTKPNVTSLLVFTAGAAYAIAAGWTTSLFVLFMVVIAVFLGSSAANTVGSYFDRDIDKIMRRTRNRPIPTGRIAPKSALLFGLSLLGVSLILSAEFLSLLSALFMMIGFLDYVVVYSYLLKRRTSLNIILGGFSGVMPVLVGYFSSNSPILPFSAALFMGFLVFFWIPEHIWSLAVRFKDDYVAAKVPMLPVVQSESNSIRFIASTSILMVAFSLVPAFLPEIGFRMIYVSAASVLGALMIILNIWLLSSPSKENAWRVFKYSSPYLFFVFSAMIADVFFFSH